MELPQQLTTDLKIVQHQMKLAIQTHQIMRIKQSNDPNNFKLDDLQEVEKRISSLGEKQNQLMRWLRKILTTIPSNSALMAKTIASSLGITVNGTHPCPGVQVNSVAFNNKCSTILKSNNNRNIHSSLKDHIKSLKACSTNEKKKPDERSGQFLINTESKDNLCERETKLISPSVPENCSPHSKFGKQHATVKNNKQTPPEHNTYLCEPLTAEKERFLSAVGLVTREVLKELQNRRVERKRRSTANHTQFVYGSNWEISAKKRKKSNYLTSTAKQHVTRQAARTQTPRTEIPLTSSKHIPIVTIFKTPLPISNQSQNEPTDNTVITSTSSLKAVMRGQPLVLNDEIDSDHVHPPDAPASVVHEAKLVDVCFVCQKTDASTIACSCAIHYHHSCAEIVENCVGCGVKLKSNIEDRRAEKHHLQDMNSRLNCEKEALEIRAAELSVTLATQAERKKNLLSMEDDVRKKIQRIHEFVAMMKNSQSVPSS